MLLYTFDTCHWTIGLQHSKYDSHNQDINGHIDPTFLHKSIKIQPTAIFTSQIIAKYIPKTNVLFKCHLYSTYTNFFRCRYETTISVYKLHKIQCNYQGCHKHWYTYMSHYLHMPMNKYVHHIAHVHPTTLITYSLHVDPTLLYKEVKQNKQVSTLFTKQASTLFTKL